MGTEAEKLEEETFSVDAKLLQELGERLVGRPYIALAELIKNAYDADARHVEVRFEGDSITVTDDGHGMSRADFSARWMRIGTTEKAREQTSPKLHRSLTGSKGVGRLATQLLGSQLEINSTALLETAESGRRSSLQPRVRALINWPEALKAKELTEVKVRIGESGSDERYLDSSSGTSIRVAGLSEDWGAAEFQDLAREVWALQSPFSDVEDDRDFHISLKTDRAGIQQSFEAQMTAIFRVANAVVAGRLMGTEEEPPTDAQVVEIQREQVEVDEQGEIDGAVQHLEPTLRNPRPTQRFLVSVKIVDFSSELFVLEVKDGRLDQVSFEIRIFDLVRRQPEGLQVGEAREYLARFGGVHIYDKGFRLPYYGPDNDWLKLELDHARRLSRSRLLPEELQSKEAMQDLPSNKRVFGVVNVSTSRSLRGSAKADPLPTGLGIQITRDRLVDNLAFEQLGRVVRTSIDLYAVARARTRAARTLSKPKSRRAAAAKVRDARGAIDAVRDDLPEETYDTVVHALSAASSELKVRYEESRAYAALLGSLATAGITSLAYEHEVSAQRGKVQSVSRRLERLAREVPQEQSGELFRLAAELQEWARRSERIRDLFRPLLEEEDRTRVGAFNARNLITEVFATLEVLARNTKIDMVDLDGTLSLPRGTFTAWSAVVQNILTNAFRATIEMDSPRIHVDGGARGRDTWIRFQDNGAKGVDPVGSERLFQPFERDSALSDRARALGLGGTGLGLTIVRMVALEMDCTVRFERPTDDWSTAIVIRWKMGTVD